MCTKGIYEQKRDMKIPRAGRVCPDASEVRKLFLARSTGRSTRQGGSVAGRSRSHDLAGSRVWSGRMRRASRKAWVKPPLLQSWTLRDPVGYERARVVGHRRAQPAHVKFIRFGGSGRQHFLPTDPLLLRAMVRPALATRLMDPIDRGLAAFAHADLQGGVRSSVTMATKAMLHNCRHGA